MSVDNASPADALVNAARELSERVRALSFADPVACVYNPLDYAWAAHESYLQLCRQSGSDRFSRHESWPLWNGTNGCSLR